MDTSTASSTALWLRHCNPDIPAARRHVVGLPYAGGAANGYATWPRYLPADVAVYGVQYPGRQDRFGEQPPVSIEHMAADIADAAAPLCGGPLVVVGHSMGAYVAYELVVELEHRYGPVVDLLVVSGVTSPHRKCPGEIHTLADADFAAVVARDNATFAELLADPDLIDVLLPMIRDDYRLFEIYGRATPVPVRAWILAMGGTEDPDVDADGLATWAEVAGAGFDLAMFSGDHFYLVDDEPTVVAAIASALPSARVGQS